MSSRRVSRQSQCNESVSLSTHRMGQCFHRGLWEMNLILFLLLALTASWTRLVQCEDNEETEEELVSEDLLGPKAEGEEENSDNHGDGSGAGRRLVADSLDLVSTPSSDSVNNQETEPTTETNTETNTDTDAEDLNPVIMIIIPLVLTLVIIAVIVCVVMIYRRRRIKAADTKEDPYLDHEDHEKVPMPMFDDDIPSVMELEMEDLENWMAKDGGKKVDTGQIQ